ncbi:hypothetical protein LPJ66_009430 [Kickxella alabastrina]|uniref:Uncharacterized protein n=1 Tax=Kickxella alabastrina TaxID=61397 RepID=A0ACC1I396_9FUNG|nr:hypothetical protein LPJ66_009430 [Kickxella alabastrina]
MLAQAVRRHAWQRAATTSAERLYAQSRHMSSAAVDLGSIAEAARADIRSKLSAFKVAELSSIMRDCGLPQGVGKEHKISALSAFIWESQELAVKRHARSTKRRAPSISEVHGSFVPKEVVSIDIGFRNLAFAHISRSGKVIDWRRVELLKEAAFEPWILAAVVEEFVHNVLPARSAASCTYVIEHQRFRSQGSAAVTNSVMVNNLIEALLYANLRHAGARVEAINPALVSAHWGFIGSRQTQSTDDNADADADDTADLGSACKVRGQKKQLIDIIARMEEMLSSQRQITSTQHALILRALDQVPSRRARTARAAPVRDSGEMMKRDTKGLGASRDLKRRLVKKERTIAMVQAWILSSLAPNAGNVEHIEELSMLASDIQSHLDVFLGSISPLGPGQQMAFSRAMAEMFCSEPKKDDLCDCIVQGVAWYRWQQRIAETLDAYGSRLLIGL